MDDMNAELDKISVFFDRVADQTQIYVDTHNHGMIKVSLNLFGNRNLSELWVLLKKGSRTSNLNELLTDHLKDCATRISPEAVSYTHLTLPTNREV